MILRNQTNKVRGSFHHRWQNLPLRLRLEELEGRDAPAGSGVSPLSLDWSTATGTDSASTLLIGVSPGTNNAVNLLAPIAAANGDSLAATGIPDVYAANGSRASLTQVASTLSSANYVRYAEPEITMSVALTPNDPKFTDNTLYGMNGAHGINAPSAWDATVGNNFVTVADIDTGLDYNHPDLYLNVWINQAEIPLSRKANLIDVDGDTRITFYDLNDPRNQGLGKITDINGDGRIDAADILAPMQKTGGVDNGLGGWADGVSQDGDTAHLDDLVGWDFVNNDNNPLDDNGHGTHTAGTIGAIGNNGTGVVGVNWQAQIMPLKFLSGSGSGSDTDAALAIHYAADHGAQVSNNSWGGSGQSSTIANAINYAGTKGHIFVAAAGNSSANDDTTFFAPASYHLSNMLVVAATSSTGALASFSNFGPTTVDLGAPGVSIYSTLPNNSYGSLSGTSMATPHVTGTVSLVISQHPTWSIAQVIQQITSTTTPDSALVGKTITGGIVNAGAAVDHDIWNGYSRDPQHTAVSNVPSQPLQGIHWQTPVDLNPQYSGNDLLIHYGSPITTQANTVIVPVKTGATGGFELEGIDGATGTVKWTQTSDYILPPHNWVPSYAPTLAPNGRVYFAGAGGTIYYITNPDANGATTSGQLAFYGLSNYTANKSAYNSSVFINTPITADSAGNIYFGFMVTGTAPGNLQGGIARIAADGTGTWVPAKTAASDLGMTKVVHNSAPALSNDGQSLYVAVNSGNGTTNSSAGYLLRLDSTTLQTLARVRLKDAEVPANDARLPDDGSASPTVGPDGDVYFGVLENNGQYASKGWLLHFSADLSQLKTPGAFGWDDTASIVDSKLVPSYTGTSPYLLFTKYNNYADFGLDGINKIAILDPNATQIDSRTGATVMKEVLTIAGPTPDPNFTAQHPNAVKEWCINSAAVDPFTKSVLANSEDGKLYRWDLTTNTFTQVVTLTPGVGEAYTPTIIGKDGTVYAINNATLFAVGISTDKTGPRVTASTPSGSVSGSVDHVTLTFSEAILDGSFTLADVDSLTGPSGAITPTAVNKISSTQYEVDFAAQSTAGDYSLTVGPHISDLAGNDMDQNQNGTNGEDPADRYSAAFTILDTTGPRVTASTPSGTVSGSADHVTLTFSEAILDGSFTLTDVDSLSGPNGAISATAVTKISSTVYEVDFAAQSTSGNYSLTVGPHISDLAGNDMDQNQNGTNGEDPTDRYTATFTVTNLAEFHFDFGTASSPVASGYTQVTDATKYSAALGYGWQSGTIASRDRGSGTDLTRDFNFTTNGTFAVDLANGTYNVTVTMGDKSYLHDLMGIFLEGVQVDSVTTAAGQFVTKTYSVTVNDGQLTLQVKDLGGTDWNSVINGLDIVTAGGSDHTGPRVTATTPSGSVSGSVDHVTLTFGEAILDGSFTLADVDGLSGPNGAITPTAVNKISSQQYEVDFAAQSTAGDYTLIVGPHISDLAGNDMDQNQNGTNGEDPADQYTATFTISGSSSGVHFDFGTSSSPLASGYTRVTEATKYGAALGYGWQNGTIASRDRGSGTNLTRDLNFTTNGTFAVDLANGTYNLTITTGDASYIHDQMGFFLEGTQVDSISTGVGQFVTRTYAVAVSDGQLTLQLKDLGGTDWNTVINGLDIVPA